MRITILAVGFTILLSSITLGQIPSNRYSPINTFGRFHGFGISDGYHECQTCREGNASLSSILPWNQLKSMSSFYGLPTPPPPPNPSLSNRIPPNPIHPGYFDVPCADNCSTYAPLFSSPSLIEPQSQGVPMAPTNMPVEQSRPNYGGSYPVAPLAQPQPTTHYPPASLPSPMPPPAPMVIPSPSDRPVPNVPNNNLYDLPKPRSKQDGGSDSGDPVGQLKRIPPGTRSWMQTSSYRVP